MDTTIYHTMGLKVASGLDDKILGFLEEGPATPDEIASELRIAWATAQGHLLKLAGTGKVSASRKGRVNIYFLTTPRRVKPEVPAWARVRSLEELSEELRPYFAEKQSAADIVRKERRKN
jgi:DNA-binding transcriptional ArsR family regulator